MIIFIFLLGYLLGSIPFALIVGKVLFGEDLRKYGSGNLGATNSVRVFGKRAGLLVLLGDAGKGIIAAFLPFIFQVEVDPLFPGIMAVLGHCFPIFAGFRGGKAIATTAGVFIVTDPLLFIIAYSAFFGVIALTKYIVFGSLSVGAAALVYSLITGDFSHTALFGAYIILLLIVHRSNLRNLAKGIEPKFNDERVKDDRIRK